MVKKSMIGMLMVGFITAMLLFTLSCQPKPTIEPGPTQAEIDAQNAQKEAEEKARLERERQEQAAADEAARLERIRQEQQRAQEAAQAAMAAIEAEKIYFDYDSSELKSDAQEILTRKADWLKDNSDYKLKIEGHCDERGSTEYNLALGGRRAEAAAKFLNALGISSNRITTISYGEEKPAVEGKNEAAWSKNRRDEFVLIQ
ncbi:MAG: peptidoglycan-associated lipoprotein Pal [Deltaproteobacteria bacterium]|nr:peptidoglycan-associated lipoprotein Pal [Deltaproteobacteria bacterium]